MLIPKPRRNQVINHHTADAAAQSHPRHRAALKILGILALCTHLAACDKKLELSVGTTSAAAPSGATAPKDTFSAPRGRYAYSADGREVKDMETGLIWQTCSVGQTWNGNTCTGEAKKFTYDEAMALSGRNERLPTVRELATLVKCSSGQMKGTADVKDGGAPIKISCDGNYTKPTIDVEAFPATPSTAFWSSSPGGNYAWYVHFFGGYVNSNSRDDAFAVRLVRASQ
jgi:hypothetical protein